MMTELQTDWDQKNTYVRATLSEMRWWRTDGTQPNLIQSTLAFVGALAALAIPFQGSSNSNSGQGPVTPTQQTEMISAGVLPAQPQHPDNAGAMAGSFSQAFAMFTCMFALANVIVSYKMRRMFKGRIMSRNDNTVSSCWAALLLEGVALTSRSTTLLAATPVHGSIRAKSPRSLQTCILSFTTWGVLPVVSQ